MVLKESTSAGRMMCLGLPQPVVGNQTCCTVKKYWNSADSTNTGMVTPKMAMNITR